LTAAAGDGDAGGAGADLGERTDMKATCFFGDGDVRVEERPEPTLEAPGDALVRVTLASVCGSDLHYYWRGDEMGIPRGGRTGHEAVGVVAAVGGGVRTLREGDRVAVFPLPVDGECDVCARGAWPCSAGMGAFGYGAGFWPYGGEVQGCQSEIIRVPFADATARRIPDGAAGPDKEHGALACVDNFATGWHAAVSAGVGPGSVVLVIGDGGVGMGAVHAASALEAAAVLCVGHHADRLRVAESLGATEVMATRDDDQVLARVMELTGGAGVHAVLQTVFSTESMRLSQRCVRPLGTISCVGMEQLAGGAAEVDWVDQFMRNVTITGGIVPGPGYLADLLDRLADGRIDPGAMFTHTLPLEEAPSAYALMADRAEGVVKVALRP
jgi:threonine dehydrogenase-like Zn-dependent dehydrogenase